MKNLTQERLREVLSYDEVTGIFTWVRLFHYNRKNWEAGSIDSSGYQQIRVDGRLYLAHKLAWLYVFGEWPEEIDHRDRNKLNNAIGNLRQASRFLNMQNIETPNEKVGKLPGAYRKVTRTGQIRWQASIGANGKQHFLGYFDTPEEANAAYLAAKTKLHKGL
jgi:hypothetical protein